jgi:aryl-alcohol dehydrogenase-like predicted oxidoreductase
VEYRQLGRSGLRVSVLALGTLPFGGHQRASLGNVGVEEAGRILDIALEAGINLIDTADIYGLGRSEEVVGAIIKGRRDRVLIATKCRAVTGDGPNDGGLSRYHILRAVEDSLRRLGTDHIDLYQAHGWDGETATEETMRAFEQLVTDGKVRYIGCSNYSAWHVMKSLGVADRLGAERFVSQQVHYSILDRDVENELIPLALDQGVGVLVWGPLAGGLLSGRYRRGADDERLKAWREPPVPDPARVFDVLDVVEQVAAEHGATPAQVSLAYILGRPGVTAAILGPRRVEHLTSALPALSLDLTAEQRGRLDQASLPHRPYPQWHQAWSAVDRPGIADADRLGMEYPRVGPVRPKEER